MSEHEALRRIIRLACLILAVWRVKGEMGMGEVIPTAEKYYQFLGDEESKTRAKPYFGRPR